MQFTIQGYFSIALDSVNSSPSWGIGKSGWALRPSLGTLIPESALGQIIFLERFWGEKKQEKERKLVIWKILESHSEDQVTKSYEDRKDSKRENRISS